MTVFESLLNHDVALSRERRTPNGQGGWQIDHVSNGVVRGRLRPASSAERELAMLESRDLTHVLYVLASTDIARGDLAEVDGLVVNVLGIREPSMANEHYEVDCSDRQYSTTASDGGS